MSWTNLPRVGLEGVGGTDLRADGSLDVDGMEAAEERFVESSGRVGFEVEADGAAVCGLEVANAVE